jgi:hypothetical protein
MEFAVHRFVASCPCVLVFAARVQLQDGALFWSFDGWLISLILTSPRGSADMSFAARKRESANSDPCRLQYGAYPLQLLGG